MFIKNKLVITKGQEKFISYNNLLVPAIRAIGEFKPFSTHIAIGCGASETGEDRTTLDSYLKTYPLEDAEYNFNPLNGTLFLTKKMVMGLEDKTPLEIVEVGLTGESGENPWIANRFLVNEGKPIYRDSGEELTMEVTIYLESIIGSGLVLTGGENRLVKLLLGSYLDKVPQIKVCRGTDESLNSTIVSREINGEKTYPAQINTEIDEGSRQVKINLSASLGEGSVSELLLLFDNEVVARQNVSEISGVVDGQTYSQVADDDNMVTLNKTGVKGVSSIIDETTGTEVTGYTTSFFGTGFKGTEYEYFSGLGYTSETKRIVAKQGNKIGFINGSTIDIFDLSDDEPVKLDTSNIDITDGYLYLIYDNVFIVKKRSAEDIYSVGYYYCDSSGVYNQKNYNLTNNRYEGVGPDGPWLSLDAVNTGPTAENRMLIVISIGTMLYAYRTFLTSTNDLYFDQGIYTTSFNTTYARGAFACNRNKHMMLSYDTKSNALVYWQNNSFKRIYDGIAVKIAKDYKTDIYPRIAKTTAFAVNEFNEIVTYSLEDKKDKTLGFGNCEKVVVDMLLEYVAVIVSEDLVDVYYLDGSLNGYKFSTGIIPEGYKVKDVEFVAGGLMIFSTDGRVFFRRISKDKLVVNGVTKGDSISLTYSLDLAPGAGGATVNANISLVVSV